MRVTVRGMGVVTLPLNWLYQQTSSSSGRSHICLMYYTLPKTEQNMNRVARKRNAYGERKKQYWLAQKIMMHILKRSNGKYHEIIYWKSHIMENHCNITRSTAEREILKKMWQTKGNRGRVKARVTQSITLRDREIGRGWTKRATRGECSEPVQSNSPRHKASSLWYSFL